MYAVPLTYLSSQVHRQLSARETAVSSTIDLQNRRGRRKYRRDPQLGVRGEWVRVSRSVDKLSLRHPCFILLYLHASWLITTAFVPCMHCSWVVGHEIDFSSCRLLPASEVFPGKELGSSPSKTTGTCYSCL